MKINFYFTDFNGRKNFTESNEKTYDGENRFTLSPLFNRMFMLKVDYKKHKKTIEIHREKKEIDEKYVIPVGVNCSPLHWAGGEFAEIPNVLYFDYEKPKNSLSNLAIPGLYFFDSQASAFAKQLKPSSRGELEIIDLLEMYRVQKKLVLEKLPRGTAWFDSGTFKDLHDASTYVRLMTERTGLSVGNPTDIAQMQGWIN